MCGCLIAFQNSLTLPAMLTQASCKQILCLCLPVPPLPLPAGSPAASAPCTATPSLAAAAASRENGFPAEPAAAPGPADEALGVTPGVTCADPPLRCLRWRWCCKLLCAGCSLAHSTSAELCPGSAACELCRSACCGSVRPCLPAATEVQQLKATSLWSQTVASAWAPTSPVRDSRESNLSPSGSHVCTVLCLPDSWIKQLEAQTISGKEAVATKTGLGPT